MYDSVSKVSLRCVLQCRRDDCIGCVHFHICSYCSAVIDVVDEGCEFYTLRGGDIAPRVGGTRLAHPDRDGWHARARQCVVERFASTSLESSYRTALPI
jgi:hypothetical protein